MGPALRKWAGRLLWVLPALLVIYTVLGIANSLWYRFYLPPGFQNANWSGNWQTERYSGLSGTLLVRLPDPLPEDIDFKVEALVYYPIYSVWKTGQFVKMDFVGRFSPKDASSAGESTNPIPGGGGGKLSFKGSANGQVVEYSAVIDETRTRIVGGYLSSQPDDHGHFSIRYY